ncbi:MAG: hypothetical protein U0K18_02265, partial [Acutalibacteraceae bacterium]|nr:hypothetical protein [Acutalibacteraceae bacterium]
MSGYSCFAEVYDSLMEDVDYPRRAEFLLKLFEKYDRRPKLMLDLACGTGGFSNMNLSIGAYNNVAAEVITTVFMLLFGINFNMYYYML